MIECSPESGHCRSVLNQPSLLRVRVHALPLSLCLLSREKFWGIRSSWEVRSQSTYFPSVSAHTAGAYTATLLVMVNVMKGGWACTPTLTARTNFTLMTECTPESSGCFSVYSVGQIPYPPSHFSSAPICTLWFPKWKIYSFMKAQLTAILHTFKKTGHNGLSLIISHSFSHKRTFILLQTNLRKHKKNPRLQIYIQPFGQGPYTEKLISDLKRFFVKKIRRVIEWLREIKTTDQHCYKFLLIQQNNFLDSM